MLAGDKAYREMRAKYTVLLPRPPEEANAATASGSSNGGAQ
jgi:hypothetical protein